MRGRMLMFAAGRRMGEQAAEQRAAQAEAYKQQGALEAQQKNSAQPEESSGTGLDLTAELQKLSDLHKSGVLSDEEFSAAKKKLLGI